MFETSELMLFIAAGLMLNITPGPDMIYCASRAIGQGKRAGVVSALGIGAGTLVHMLSAALGLSVLLTYSAVAFQIVKYVGAAYLVYLGVRMIAAGEAAQSPVLLAGGNLRKIFWQAVTTNVLNPKVALFFLSFLPQFVHPSRGSVMLQISLLSLIFIVNGTLVLILLSLLFGRLGSWLETRPRFWKAQRWTTGGMLAALGVSLALWERE